MAKYRYFDHFKGLQGGTQGWQIGGIWEVSKMGYLGAYLGHFGHIGHFRDIGSFRVLI